MTAITHQPGQAGRVPCATPFFSKVIVLDYYDGPRAGVAHCATCDRTYRFDLLDQESGDDGEDVRVFRLTGLPSDAFDRVLSASPNADAARWPVWVPIWQFSNEAARQRADAAVGRVLSEAGPPELVVASSDGLRTLVACKPVPSSGFSGERDWFEYLALPRRKA